MSRPLNAYANTLLDSRRRALLDLATFFGGAAALGLHRSVFAQTLGSCETPAFSDGFEATTAAAQALRAPTGTCVLIPSETQGPYPLLSVLSNPDMIRQDITEGRTGVPMRINLTLVNLNDGCAPLPDLAVYIWQCDKDGVYSGYAQPGGVNTVGQTFCRGIQYTDCNGVAAFTTMYPGWYNGRITHTHFQVYLDTAGSVTATSQLAYPPEITTVVYNSALYSAHGQNTSVPSFASDNVFSDGYITQLLSVTGDINTGYVGELIVGIAV
jgi:protocatechuate 3,4-dioxygenase beta subunit